jgi:fibronectin-binding autotransporter adhesin
LVVEGRLGTGGSYAGNFSNSSSDTYGLILNTSSDQTLSGVLSGSGFYTVYDTDASGPVTLSGSNDFTSALKFVGGKIIVGHADAFGSNSILNLTTSNTKSIGIADGITMSGLELTGSETLTLTNNFRTGNLSSSSGAAIDLQSFTLTVGSDNSSTSYNGVISNSGGLTKSGSGTLTLSGTNTYTGATTIHAGTLEVDWYVSTNCSYMLQVVQRMMLMQRILYYQLKVQVPLI